MHLQEGVGDVAIAAAGANHPHALQRRPSNLHLNSNSMAGDLHTSEHTKKDAKEVRPTLGTVVKHGFLLRLTRSIVRHAAVVSS